MNMHIKKILMIAVDERFSIRFPRGRSEQAFWLRYGR